MNSPKLNSLTLGSGDQQIVILHGWGNNLEYWRSFAELLSPFATVHLIDLPGFGRSDMPPKPWGVTDYAQCVVDFLKEKGIAKATLLGHSFGGRISVVIAAEHPELVEKLILLNAHGLTPKRSFQQRAKIYYIKALRSVVKKIDQLFGKTLFRDWFSPRYASVDYKNAGELRLTFLKVINQTLEDYATKITAPTLLLWGELDTETPLSIGEKYKELIKESELVVLKKKGHNMFLDVSGHLCLMEIKKFLGLKERRGDE